MMSIKQKQNKITKEKNQKKQTKIMEEKKTYLVVYGTNLAKVQQKFVQLLKSFLAKVCLEKHS